MLIDIHCMVHEAGDRRIEMYRLARSTILLDFLPDQALHARSVEVLLEVTREVDSPSGQI